MHRLHAYRLTDLSMQYMHRLHRQVYESMHLSMQSMHILHRQVDLSMQASMNMSVCVSCSYSLDKRGVWVGRGACQLCTHAHAHTSTHIRTTAIDFSCGVFLSACVSLHLKYVRNVLNIFLVRNVLNTRISRVAYSSQHVCDYVCACVYAQTCVSICTCVSMCVSHMYVYRNIPHNTTYLHSILGIHRLYSTDVYRTCVSHMYVYRKHTNMEAFASTHMCAHVCLSQAHIDFMWHMCE